MASCYRIVSDRAIFSGSLAAVCWLLVGSACFGQVSQRGLIGPEYLAPLGLQMAWSTQIEVDRGSDRVVGVTQHVSNQNLQTIYEFTFDNRF